MAVAAAAAEERRGQRQREGAEKPLPQRPEPARRHRLSAAGEAGRAAGPFPRGPFLPAGAAPQVGARRVPVAAPAAACARPGCGRVAGGKGCPAAEAVREENSFAYRGRGGRASCAVCPR